ncbi:MAG: hypothetical protein ACR2IE_09225 [Candidatus Sumerlaeaceae bacterium]
MRFTKLAFALPAVALLAASTPTTAEARTKTIVKYGAIGLGAAALYNMGQQSSYGGGYYGGGYGGGYYSGGYDYYPSYSYPSHSYYSYPSHSYYPSYGYGGGYYY